MDRAILEDGVEVVSAVATPRCTDPGWCRRCRRRLNGTQTNPHRRRSRRPEDQLHDRLVDQLVVHLVDHLVDHPVDQLVDVDHSELTHGSPSAHLDSP